eukprot:10654613-Lingulodinium_polyedra.AAC.1
MERVGKTGSGRVGKNRGRWNKTGSGWEKTRSPSANPAPQRPETHGIETCNPENRTRNCQHWPPSV